MAQDGNDGYSLREIKQAGHRKRPTPADFGLDVSICIAAKSLISDTIVSVSDRMLSFDDAAPAIENAVLKDTVVSPHCRTLFAGDDVSPAHFVIDRAKTQLATTGETEAEVRTAIFNALQDETHAHSTAKYLARLGIDLPYFRANGFQEFGPEQFGKIFKAIQDFSLNLEFLVYGFEPNGGPRGSHIFSLLDSGVISHDLEGRGIIGSGVYLAAGAIAGRTLWELPTEEVVYRLCAAKFSAQTARGVGKETTVLVLQSDGQQFFWLHQDVEKLRAIWEKEERDAPVPSSAVQLGEEVIRRRRKASRLPG